MPSRRVDGARALAAEPATTLVAIGNFDGVHRGHRAVIRAGVERAAERGLSPLVLTFHPHPSEVLGRGRRAPMLTAIDRKVELITRIDPALRVVVEPFTLELSKETPRQFVEQLLVGQLGARVVLVGDNFRFGHDRAGDLATLVELGQEFGFEAGAEPLIGDGGGAYSSTRVRQLVAAGDVRGAAMVLGRPHSLAGLVVEGDQRGRTIGVPTANLDAVREALPPNGVYACVVDRLEEQGATALGAGVTNIGRRPTVDGTRLSIEAHLLDFDADLYGARLRVHLIERLRDELRFSGLDELKAQIARDIAAARPILERTSPDPEALGAWY